MQREERKTQERLVISFGGSTEAQIFASAAQEAGISGRLIPKPREFSADCGQAFMTAIENASLIEALIKEEALEYEEIRKLLFKL